MFNFSRIAVGKDNKKVIFILNGWKGKAWQILPVARLLKLKGYNCVVYSYDNSILSPDIKLTRQNIIEVKNDVVRQVKLLHKQGKTKFIIIGNSLGSIIGVLAANESQLISKLILNSIGADIAETIWTWDSVNDNFKKRLLRKQPVTLKELKREWEMISPIYHLDKLKNKQILVYLSKKDEIIPYKQGMKIVNEFKKRKYDVVLKTNINLNHYISCGLNYHNIIGYLSFLKK